VRGGIFPGSVKLACQGMPEFFQQPGLALISDLLIRVVPHILGLRFFQLNRGADDRRLSDASIHKIYLAENFSAQDW